MFIIIQNADIEDLVKNQKSAIRLYTLLAFGIVIFGFSLLIFGNIFFENDSVKTIINIGGAFISTLTGFPVKEIVARKDRINTYDILKRHLKIINEIGDEIEDQEKQKIIDLILEIIKKNALNF
jgi:hypothetical protein